MKITILSLLLALSMTAQANCDRRYNDCDKPRSLYKPVFGDMMEDSARRTERQRERRAQRQHEREMAEAQRAHELRLLELAE